MISSASTAPDTPPPLPLTPLPVTASSPPRVQEFFQFLVDRAHEELLALRKAHFPHLVQQPAAAAAPAASPSTPGATPAAATSASSSTPGAQGTTQGDAGDAAPPADEGEWLQAGRRGARSAAVTRQVGSHDMIAAAAAAGASSASSAQQGSTGGAAVPATAPASTPLYSIFCGSIRSVVRAPVGKPSATIQPFTHLHLHIHDSAISSIETALQHNLGSETVGGCGVCERLGVRRRRQPQLAACSTCALPLRCALHLSAASDQASSIQASCVHAASVHSVKPSPPHAHFAPLSSLLTEYKAEGSSVATMAKKTTSLYHLPEVRLVANRAAAGMGKHLIASVTFADEKGGWEGRRSRPTDPQCSPVVSADKQPCKRRCCPLVCSAVGVECIASLSLHLLPLNPAGAGAAPHALRAPARRRPQDQQGRRL